METRQMSENEQLNMQLISGIAAFEGKNFTVAVRTLSPLADQGDPEAQYASPSWRKTVWV